MRETLSALRERRFDILRYENKIAAAIMAVLLVLPLVVRNKVVVNVFTLILLYIILVSSLNVVNGYSSQFNVGSARANASSSIRRASTASGPTPRPSWPPGSA